MAQEQDTYKFLSRIYGVEIHWKLAPDDRGALILIPRHKSVPATLWVVFWK
jgi:hypothetical protein